jgi:cyclase
MPTLLYKELGLVKGVKFDSWRRVGGVVQSIKVYNMREVDELVFLDIAASRDGRGPEFDTVDEIADECFMPLTVGGGVRTVDDVHRLLQNGADKVSINSAAVDNPRLIREVADNFGTQCVVVSIDARLNRDGRYEIYSHSGTRATGKDPVKFAQDMEWFGAGEILLTSIDRDGTLSGYDLELTRSVCQVVSIPVIASGGAGSYEDMERAICEAGACAVAAASMFHFTQQTPLEAKRYLRDRGIAVRL